MSFEIQSNIAVPARTSSKPEKYPFTQLQNGQSFFVPNRVLEDGTSKAGISPSTVGGATKRAAAAGCGHIQFVYRNVTEDGVAGTRVWRQDAVTEAPEAPEADLFDDSGDVE